LLLLPGLVLIPDSVDPSSLPSFNNSSSFTIIFKKKSSDGGPYFATSMKSLRSNSLSSVQISRQRTQRSLRHICRNWNRRDLASPQKNSQLRSSSILLPMLGSFTQCSAICKKKVSGKPIEMSSGSFRGEKTWQCRFWQANSAEFWLVSRG